MNKLKSGRKINRYGTYSAIAASFALATFTSACSTTIDAGTVSVPTCTKSLGDGYIGVDSSYISNVVSNSEETLATSRANAKILADRVSKVQGKIRIRENPKQDVLVNKEKMELRFLENDFPTYITVEIPFKEGEPAISLGTVACIDNGKIYTNQIYDELAAFVIATDAIR